MANTVEFLLSDKARNITGTVLTVDAGATACPIIAALKRVTRNLRVTVARSMYFARLGNPLVTHFAIGKHLGS